MVKIITEKTLPGHISALLTITIWGTTYVSTKVLLGAFLPVEILILRFTVALIALNIAVPRRLIIKDYKKEIYFALAGLCGVTLYYLLESVALTYTAVSNAGAIIAVSPLFTAILSRIILKNTKLQRRFFIGLVISISGIIIVAFNGKFALQLNPFGDLLVLLSAIAWAFYCILTKKIGDFGYNIIQSTRRIFFYGVIFLLPTLFIFKTNFDTEVIFHMPNLLNILYLGLGASAIGFVTWNYSVKTLGPVKTSIYIYLSPIVSVLSSAIILHEKITITATIGIALILCGLLISEGKLGAKI